MSKKKYIYVVMAALCMLFILILPLGHDLHFHIYRIGAMAEELERTGFSMPIRILSASYNNYGYGVPLFYGDTLLYIPAILVILGVDEVFAYKLLIVAMFLMVYVAMYWQMYRVTKKKDFSFMCAVFYSFSSYFLTDLCIRASVGEACTFIFLPFVFSAFYNMLYQPSKYDWVYLTIGMSGLILTHNLTAFFTAAILLVWGIVKIRNLCKKRSLCKIILAAVATFGVVASYILPMLEAMLVQKYQTPGNNGYQMEQFPKNTLDVYDFFFPYEIKKGLKVVFGFPIDTAIWHPGAVGIFLILIFVLLYKTRKMKKRLSIQIAFLLAVVLYVYMFIKPVVEWSGKYISFMQFAWRLLTFSTFVFSLYAAYLLEILKSNKWKKAYVVLAVFVGIYTIGARYFYQAYLDYKGMEYIQEMNQEFADNYNIKYSPNAGDNMYLPEGVSLYLYKERGEVVKSNHEDVDISYKRQNGKILLEIENNMYDDLSIELPLYYYKGYRALGHREYVIKPSKEKLVEVKIGNVTNEKVTVWYDGTWTQMVSNCVSFITIIGMITYVIIQYYHKKRTKRTVCC